MNRVVQLYISYDPAESAALAHALDTAEVPFEIVESRADFESVLAPTRFLIPAGELERGRSVLENLRLEVAGHDPASVGLEAREELLEQENAESRARVRESAREQWPYLLGLAVLAALFVAYQLTR